MKKVLVLLIVVLIALLPLTAIASNFEWHGSKWKTIDDETGKPKSLIQLTVTEGKLSGRILRLLAGADPTVTRVKAPADDLYQRHGRKLGMGTLIIADMVLNGDKWEGGTILEPKTGKLYKCQLWLSDTGELKVRGSIAFFYRTQTWKPVD